MYSSLQCPICKSKLMNTDSFVVSEVHEYLNLDDLWKPDYVLKCWKCKKQIGIKKVGIRKAG